MSNNKRNERRRLNYRKLIAAGFSGKEATVYKNYSKKRIDKMIVERKEFSKKMQQILSGKQVA